MIASEAVNFFNRLSLKQQEFLIAQLQAQLELNRIVIKTNKEAASD